MSGAMSPLSICFHGLHSYKHLPLYHQEVQTQTCRSCIKFMSAFLKIGKVIKILDGRSRKHKNTQNDNLFPKERKAVIKRIVYCGPTVRSDGSRTALQSRRRSAGANTSELIRSLSSCFLSHYSASAGSNPRYTH